MFAPPCEKLRVLRCAREFRFGAARWSSILDGIDFDESACLSDKPWGTVWRVTAPLPDGETPLVIKVHAARSPRDKVRSSLRLTRLRRQWRGSAKLSRAGFPAARCRAMLTGEREGRRLDVLVMDAQPGRTLLETLSRGDLSIDEERALSSMLGELTNALWYSGLHSKDLKPSNLMVSRGGGSPVVTILDTDAVGHRPAHPLLPLVLEPTGMGVLPRRALLFRVVRAWAWHAWLSGPDRFAPEPGERPRRMESRIARRAWREIEALVVAHGDATPAHNPIRPNEPVAQEPVLG